MTTPQTQAERQGTATATNDGDLRYVLQYAPTVLDQIGDESRRIDHLAELLHELRRHVEAVE